MALVATVHNAVLVVVVVVMIDGCLMRERLRCMRRLHECTEH